MKSEKFDNARSAIETINDEMERLETVVAAAGTSLQDVLSALEEYSFNNGGLVEAEVTEAVNNDTRATVSAIRSVPASYVSPAAIYEWNDDAKSRLDEFVEDLTRYGGLSRQHKQQAGFEKSIEKSKRELDLLRKERQRLLDEETALYYQNEGMEVLI